MSDPSMVDVLRAGYRDDETLARRGLGAVDDRVRLRALGALERMGRLSSADLLAALDDVSRSVRHRAIESAACLRTGDDPNARSLDARLIGLLSDADVDPSSVELAAWALGERHELPEPEGDDEEPVAAEAAAVASVLAVTAVGHPDVLVREAGVAALGSIGDTSTLPAVLGALRDKATVRRRAVIALAAFEGPEVDAALHRALEDRDWQVRQAAEDLLSIGP